MIGSKALQLVVLLAASLFFHGEAHARGRIALLEGSLAMFATPQVVQVEFTYDDMRVGDSPEAAYLARKVDEKNQKEPGSGDLWADAWTRDREARFHPKFIGLLNKAMEGKATFGTNVASPTYVMIVAVVRTEPGFYSYAVNKPAELDFDVRIVAPADPATVLARPSLVQAPGRPLTTFEFADTGARIAAGYAKGAKDLGTFIAKNAK